MKKLISLLVSIITVTELFAQNFKSEGDTMVAAGNYSGAAAMYEICMIQDDDCLLKYFKLIFEEKIRAQFSDELYKLIYKLANEGNAEAQYYLGNMYRNGKGVTKDNFQAYNWYKKSAEQDNAIGQYYFGTLHEDFFDYEALIWYHRAAAQGNQDAINALTRLERGDKVFFLTKSTYRAIIEERERSLPAAYVGREEEKQFTFGIQAGFNLTNIDYYTNTKLKPGFKIGFVGNYAMIGNQCYIQSGILFATRGCKGAEDFFGGNSGDEESVNINLNYIQIPANIQWKATSFFFFQFGLYFGYAVDGKAIIKSGDKKEKEKIEFGRDKDMKATDLGIGFDLGLEFGNIQVSLGYIFGCYNTSTDSRYKWNNYGYTLTATYMFGK